MKYGIQRIMTTIGCAEVLGVQISSTTKGPVKRVADSIIHPSSTNSASEESSGVRILLRAALLEKRKFVRTHPGVDVPRIQIRQKYWLFVEKG